MKNYSKKILMIAYYFPPLGGSAALRPLKIAKHLPKYGWKPFIITVKNPEWYYAQDPQLLNELSIKTKILKSFTIKSVWIYWLMNPMRIRKLDNLIKSILLIPDEHIGWLPATYRLAKSAIKKFDLQLIYSTSGPMTSHLIAYLLKKETGIPWIADFRDEWFEDPQLDFPTSFHRKFQFWIEKVVVNEADKITCMAPLYKKCLAKHTKKKNKFVIIPAGFDRDDVISKPSSKLDVQNSSKFTLTFTGLFYNTFKPKNLLQAVSELIAEKKIVRDKIKIKFVGANKDSDLDYRDRYKICEFTGFLPRNEAIKHATGSSVLLLLLSEERGKDVIPSKVFEYLASGKTILAIVPSNGEVANIIRKTKSGIVAEFGNVSEIKTAILKLYSMWKENALGKYHDMQEIEKYNQINLFNKLDKILQEITQ